ncbi:manganese-dependent inorganic pyrophosphatase [Kiloniella sp.]|uniref:manganese-dependent inorganic pyrophosphatase n=1 Tax=Kiloniella sp. TaxID=1938587 RepID=UPI003B018ABD
MIKIFGHLAPDTDATCSALIWAWYLKEIKGQEAEAFVLETPNTEAQFVLERWGFDMPATLGTLEAGQDVVIVDTNNPAELPDNVNEANIIEIIDHHLLVGGIKTKQPINITIKPVASTATIMIDLISHAMRKAPRGIKGLMLSCILSDTLAFRSPTTTKTDIKKAKELAKDLGVNIKNYAAEMFAAKSDVSHFSDAELLRLDSKKYEVGDVKFRVSVLETTSPETIFVRKDSLISTMSSVASEDGVDQVLLFVVNILAEEATLLVANDVVKSVAEKSFDVSVSGDTVVLPGVVSRKKQIIPSLTV